MNGLTHLDKKGNAKMVDVSQKNETARSAAASGRIYMSPEAFSAINEGNVPKGDVLATARIAGIMAVKQTSTIIPLCHPLRISGIVIEFEAESETNSILCRCIVNLTDRTGAEMEALTGVSAALLTVYDMCKAIDRTMEITDIHLDEKKGGKSGTIKRGDN